MEKLVAFDFDTGPIGRIGCNCRTFFRNLAPFAQQSVDRPYAGKNVHSVPRLLASSDLQGLARGGSNLNNLRSSHADRSDDLEAIPRPPSSKQFEVVGSKYRVVSHHDDQWLPVS